MGNLLGERVRLGQQPVPGEGAGNFSWYSLMIALLLAGTGAAPASARVLVSNINKIPYSVRDCASLRDHDHAQGFTTGTASAGYLLNSIEVRSRPGTTPVGVTVKVATALSSDVVATLTSPSPFSAGINTFTAPEDTTLNANTEYFVIVTGGSGDVCVTSSDSEDKVDSRGDSGWSIGDKGQKKENNAWIEVDDARMIRVNGKIVTDIETVEVTSTPRLTTDTYGEGEKIQVTVTFDEAVTVTGNPFFRLRMGDSGSTPADKDAAYASGTGTNALVFEYTVLATDSDNNGIWIPVNALMLGDGDAIQNGAGKDMVLNYDQLGGQGSHKVDGRRKVTSIVRQTPSSSPTNADSLTWRITFDENVNNVDASDFTVSGTSATLTVSEITASTVYDVTASGGDLAGLNDTVTLAFSDSQDIEDASNNALVNTTPTGDNHNTYVVDNFLPLVESIQRQSPPSSPTNADTLTWQVTFDEDVKDVDASDFTVSGTSATLTVSEVMAATVYDVTASGGDLASLNATVTLAFSSSQDIKDTADNALTDTRPTDGNNNTYVVDNTGLSLVFTGAPVTVAEGGSANYTVKLSAQPSGDVTVNIVSESAVIADVTSAELTFTTDNWDTSQSVTVTASENSNWQNETVRISHSISGTQVGTVNVTVTDNDSEPPLLVGNLGERQTDSEPIPYTGTFKYRAQAFTTGSNVAGYDLQSVHLALATAPVVTGDIRVSIREDGSLGRRSSTPTTVIATLTNPSDVTRAGIRGFNAPANTTVTLAPNTTYWVYVETPHYRFIQDYHLSVTSSPNQGGESGWEMADKHERYSQTIDNTGAIRLRINGTAIVDATAPTFSSATVTGTELVVSFDETLAGAANLANAAFTVKKTSQGSNTATTVELSPIVAPSISGDKVTLTLDSAVALSDTVTVSYAPPATDDNNRLEDPSGNEVASFSNQAVTNIGASLNLNFDFRGNHPVRVDEGGVTMYTVKLREQPTTDVTVNIESKNVLVVTVEPASLTFTTDNWNTPQEVTLTGVEDNNWQDEEIVEVTHKSQQGSSRFNVRLRVTVEDDDSEPSSVLVSKFDQTLYGGGGLKVGMEDLGNNVAANRQQSFTTGDNHSGYTLDSVYLNFINAPNSSGGITVSILRHGDPDSTTPLGSETVGTLTNLSDVTVKGIRRFDAPVGGITLAPNTKYWLRIDAAQRDSEYFVLAGTNTATVDSDSLSNWSMPDEHYTESRNPIRATRFTVSLQVRLDGSANPPDKAAPTVSSATVKDNTLVITFDESLSPADDLANSAFTVKKTPQNGSETTQTLTGSPSISGDRVTLTLATAVASTDTDIKVSYVKPNTDNNNRIKDRAETPNEAESFTDQAVINVTPPTLVFTGAPVTVTEGRTATYTVKLSTQPPATVTVDVASDDEVVATVLPASLTFTTDNWDTSQNVTVTGVEDSNWQSDEAVTISHSILGELADAVSVTVNDEGSEPPLLVGNLGESQTTTAPIPHTGDFLYRAQAFTTGSNVAGYDLQSVHLDLATAPEVANDIEVSIREDGSSWRRSSTPTGVIVTLDNPSDVKKAGIRGFNVPANTTVTLAPNTTYWVYVRTPHFQWIWNDYHLSVTSSTNQGGESGWEMADKHERYSQIIDTTGAIRLRINGTAIVDATAPTFSSATVNGTELVITFDEPLAAAANLANAAFTVKKTPQGSDTAATVELSTNAAPTISGDKVTLTLASDVAVADTVTVSYTKPATDDSNRLEDPSGNEVANFSDQAVNNTTSLTLDLLLPGIPMIVPEGGTVTYGVVLPSRPSTDVTVSIESENALIATAMPASLTFTPSNWDNRQNVTVTGVQDNNWNDETTVIRNIVSRVGVRLTSGVSVRVEDDDSEPSSVLVSKFDQTLFEGGPLKVGVEDLGNAVRANRSQSFTTGNNDTGYTLDSVYLNFIDAPDSSNGISVSILRHRYPDIATPVGAELVGTLANLSDVTLTGIRRFDAPVGGITLAPNTKYWLRVDAAQSGSEYFVLAGTDTATVDSDSLSNWSMPNEHYVENLNPISATRFIVSLQVRLDGSANPADTAAPTVSSATVNGNTLVISFDESLSPASNLANTAFTVKKTPQNGSETTQTLTGSPSISGNRVTLTLATAVVSTDTDIKVSYAKPNTDDNNRIKDRAETPNEAASFTDQAVTNVTPPTLVFTGAPVTVTEGRTATYTMKLDTQPTAAVTVDVASDDEAVATALPTSLTFTTSNWDTTQNVTVTGVEDSNWQDETVAISHGVSGEAASTVNVTVTDDDSEPPLLVGNLTEAETATEILFHPGNFLSRAQAFTTGSNVAGYELQSVHLDLHDAPDSSANIVVTIREAGSSNRPSSTVVATLDNPSDVTRNGIRGFTVPGGATVTLAASTTYWVHVELPSQSPYTGGYKLSSTTSGNQSGATADWLMADDHVFDSSGRTNSAIRLRINGVANVDTTAPTFSSAAVNGTELVISFDEPLAAAANLANTAFTVKKTTQGSNTATTVQLSKTPPSITGAAVTLTLAALVEESDTVTVSYTKPVTDDNNRLEDSSGNEVASFSDQTVTNNTVGRKVTTNEDTTYTFQASDFSSSGTLTSVEITSLLTEPKSPSTDRERLYRGNDPIVFSDVVNSDAKLTFSNTDLGNGLLTYRPPANFNGETSFTFNVNGGSTDIQMTINVTPVDDASTGEPKITWEVNDSRRVLTANTSDIKDVDGLGNPRWAYQWVRANDAVGAGAMDIASATDKTYTLVEEDRGKYISVKVSFTDGGDTTTMLTSNAVGPVTALDGTVTMDEDTTYTFGAGDFGFSNVLTTVELETLPYPRDEQGALKLDGTVLDSARTVTVTKEELDNNKLTYEPPAHANGAVVTFDFGVNGLDDVLSQITINVTPVNDEPSGLPQVTGSKRVDRVLTADPSEIRDADGLTTPNWTYQWMRADNEVGAGAEEITSAIGKTYTLVAADLGKYISVKVSFTDDDNTTETLTSTAVGPVEAANNPPTASDSTVTTYEDSGSDGVDNSYRFQASDFKFGDADSDDLAGVTIVTLPAREEGSLRGIPEESLPVRFSKEVLENGELIYDLSAGENVFRDNYATFTFKVDDGKEDSTHSYTMTINVASVPDVTQVEITSSPLSENSREEKFYGLGEKIQFTVTFDEAVVVTGTPQFEFQLAAQNVGEKKQATYVSGSGSDKLVFEYTVERNKQALLGISIGPNKLTLNGGTIRGGDGSDPNRDADLSHEAIDSGNLQSGHRIDADLAVRVKAIERQAPSSSPTNADSLTWRWTFAENVKNVDAAAFRVSSGTKFLTVSEVTVSEVTASTVYDVTFSGGELTDLNDTVFLGLSSNSDIKDLADNELQDFNPTSETNEITYVVDNTKPSVSITDVPATSTAAFSATFSFSEAVTGFAMEDVTVGNGAASDFSVTRAGEVWTALITPSATGTVTMEMAAGVATDLAGNENTAAPLVSSTYTSPVAGVSVSPTNLSVGEDGTTTYMVVLNAQPSGTVTVTPSSGDTGAATLIPSSLTFTGGNWDTAQTVTVSGEEDDDVNNETVAISHSVSGYGSVTTATDVSVTVSDNDTAGVSVSPTSLSVNESGTTTYTVVLTTEPSGTVTVTPSSSDTGAATLSPSSLTFTSGNWKTAQTVTVSGAEDDDANDETVAISHSVSGYGSVTTAAEVSGTVSDNDTAGVSVSPTSLSVNEGGTTTYTVVLNTEPSGTVTVTPSSGDTGAATLSPSSLTFTSGNWDTAQTVTVSGEEDDDVNNETVAISHSVSGYGSVTTAAEVSVTVSDNDTAGVSVSPTSLSVNESGTTTYTVVLNTEPSGTVTVTPSSGDTGAATLSPSSLTFTSGNWKTAQTVTVSGEEDDDVNNETVAISHSVSGYGSVTTATDVSVTVSDNDTAGVSVSPTSLSVNESGTTTYTVVLTTEPSGTVTVTPSSSDTGAATLSPSSLTFTSGNWKTAQTVTVSGAEDDDANDETVAISHSVSGYGSVTTAAEVSVTVNDNDTAGVSVSPTSLSVNESGTTTYTVVLNTEPSSTVTVTPSSGDTGAATLSPSSLTFTSGNWKTAQTVTVSGEEDDDVNNETVAISHSVSGYGSVTTAAEVSVTVNDNDTAGVSVSPTSLSVNESGTTTYTVVLNTEPSGTVTVTPSSGDTGAATLSPSSLTFTSGNWDTAQTVTVSGEEDDDANDETVAISHSVSGYGSVTTAANVSVTVSDNDTAGVSVSPTSLSVNESGTTTYTVVLNTEPSGTVTVTPSSGDTGAATLSPSSLTFTSGNWDTAQTVTVLGEEDDDANDETVAISHSVSGYGSVTTAAEVSVTVSDNDTAGVSVSPTSLSVNESGTTTYTVVLNTEPSGTVTVTPSSGDTDAATLSPSSLTFTSGNWDTAQTVTVSGAEDDDVNDETVAISHSVSGYGSVTTAANVSVTVNDNDTAGVSVSPTSLSVNESGTTTYTVVLTTEPSGTVTVTPSSGDTGAATLSPSSLTFTSGNWDTAQTVMVSGAEDDDANDETVAISHSVSGYGSVTTAAEVSVTVNDNDTAGVSVSPTSLSVNESGTTTYTVVLNTEPSSTVTVTPSSGDTGAATLSPSSLTFTSGNWKTAQTVTVSGEEDDDVNNETVAISHSVSGYGSVTTAAEVSVTVNDNDTAGVSVSPTSLSVNESGTTTYTVVLNTEPSGTVTVTPSSGDTGAATLSPSSLTFTSGNWDTAQTVTVSGEEDDDANDETVAISHSVSGYGSVTTAANVSVTVSDNDTAGVSVSPTSLSVNESGTTTYTVVLNTEPSGTVTVTPSSGDTGAATLSPSSLTFTSGNWDTAQTVTVSGEEDDDANDETVAISHSVSGYGSVTTAAEVSVTVSDNDTAGVSVSPTSLSVNESGTTTYTVVLNTEPSGTVTVTPSSGDTDAATLSPSSLTFTSGNWDTAQTVTVSGAEDDDVNDETVAISHSVSGYGSVTTAANVSVTVNDNDTAGVSVSPTSLSVNESGTTTYTVVLTTEPSGTVTVTPSSGDTGAATLSPSSLTFTSGNWDTAQTVMVSGAEDDDANDETVAISHSVSGYGSVTTAAEVSVTVNDNDTAGVSVSPTSLSVNESGTTTYTVVLNTEPSSTVTVTPSSGDTGAATFSPSRLTFTSGNWDTAQTVTVSGAEDDDANDETVAISHSVSGYGSVTTAAEVSVTVNDNDTAVVSVSPTSLSVEEGGTTTYTVVLATEPSGTVTVTPSSGDTGAATLSPSSLTFTSGNWDTAQTVTVSGAEDDDVNNETVAISHSVSGYGSVTTAANVSVTVNDNDMAGVSVSPTSLSVNESGTTTYTVVLNTEPSGTVTVTPSSGDTGAATLSPSTLTFTSGNWDTAQTVTVSGEEDDDANDETVAINHSVSGYGSVTTAADVSVTVSDNDTAGVSVSPTSLSVNESGTTTYTVVLTTEPSSTVTVTPSSNDTGAATLSPSSLTFTSGNWKTAQTVTVSGEEDDDANDETVAISHSVSGYGSCHHSGQRERHGER